MQKNHLEKSDIHSDKNFQKARNRKEHPQPMKYINEKPTVNIIFNFERQIIFSLILGTRQRCPLRCIGGFNQCNKVGK